MNYLQLCQQVVRRGAVVGAHAVKPDSVVDQVGRMLLVTDWVALANTEIQSYWNDYSFRSREIDMQVDADSDSAAMPDVNRVNENAVFVRDDDSRKQLTPMTWACFRNLRGTQIVPTSDALPDKFSIDPAGNMHFYPVCTRQFIIRVEAVMNPQVLKADIDEPWIPEAYHNAIIYRAMMEFHEYDEAQMKHSAAQKNFSFWLDKLDGACLPNHDMHNTSMLETPLQMYTP